MTITMRREGRIALITIDNPSRMNALGTAALNELQNHLMDFDNDPDLRVGIITGTGDKAFCSGFDATEFSDVSPVNRQTILTGAPLRGLEVARPLIAAVNGEALGGGLELMLLCDLRIASDKAIFGFPEVKLGLIPAWGGTQRLPRQITLCQAAELIFTGENIDAQTALRIGLVNHVVPPDQVLPSALKLAHTICRSAPLAVSAAKEAMLKGLQVSLEDGLQIEDALFGYLKTTADFREGTRAFREKRLPDFKGG